MALAAEGSSARAQLSSCLQDQAPGQGAKPAAVGSPQILQIDLSDFDKRKDEIVAQILLAATDAGFFQVVNHGIPQADVDRMFALSEAFFALPEAAKASYPFDTRNRGWECNAQRRPSTPYSDLKESLQLKWHDMEGPSGSLWPSQAHAPGLKAAALRFMAQCDAVSGRLLACLALGLGLPHDFFTQHHDPSREDNQACLRLLHYYGLEGSAHPPGQWRASPHADFDTVTMLFQRPGQAGLEVLPGKDATSRWGEGDTWTPVDPVAGAITINFGGMLTRWTDGQVKATLHRVRAPRPGEHCGPRYSIAYFNQANRDSIIQGPAKKYPPITGGDYIKEAISALYK